MEGKWKGKRESSGRAALMSFIEVLCRGVK